MASEWKEKRDKELYDELNGEEFENIWNINIYML